MMNIAYNTLRPGLLVSLKTSVTGNVKYRKEEIVRDHLTEDGRREAAWQTERVINDPKEHEDATTLRSKASGIIRRVCAHSAFGLLCPEDRTTELDDAIGEARRLVDEFNRSAKITRVGIYVMAGRIAPDDVEAVRAINSELRDMMQDMETGLQNLDVKAVREAASRARRIGTMLSPEAAARVQLAIDTARGAANRINAAGEQAAAEIDRAAIKRIGETRMSFLDLDDQREIAAPSIKGRAVDFEPSTPPAARRRRETARNVEV